MILNICFMRDSSWHFMGVARIFFGGGTLFQKICKKFCKNFQKNYKNIQQNFKKLKKIFPKFSKKFQENYKNFVKKIANNGFVSIFFKKFNKLSIQFLRVWRKNAICRKFLRKFSEENCKKCIILAYFSKILTNPAFKFCAFRRKTQCAGNFRENFPKKLMKNALF